MRTIATTCGLLAVCALPAPGQTLTEQSYARIKKSLRLTPAESHWQQIPWRPDLGTAIREAREKKMPILLWVMNGHPCGMT